MDKIKLLGTVPIWLFAMSLRAILILIGIPAVALSLVADGAKRTPPMWEFWIRAEETPAYYSTSRWKKFYWWAIRNPTVGLHGKLKQPIPEVHPNPDSTVRGALRPSDSRYMEHGVFWEYWYLRKVGDKYFEFRIGWKFVDGNDEFFPTIQLRLGG